MVGRAAGNDEDAIHVFDIIRRHIQIVQHHPAVPDAGRDGLADSLGLFKDLLDHKVGVAALLRRRDIPVHRHTGLIHRHQLAVEHIDAVPGDDGDLSVVHIAHIPGIAQDGGDVGGQEISLLAIPQDQGAVLAGGNDGIGIIAAQNAEGVGALDPVQGTGNRVQHVAVFPIVDLQ